MRIEYHILQSFPVSCLNRDDVGSPKTAIIGGTQRARVSSQAWKRPVRMMLHDIQMENQHLKNGVRTKLIGNLISEACLALGASNKQATTCGDAIEGAFIKKSEPKPPKKTKKTQEIEEEQDDDEYDSEESSGKTDTLLFISPNEVTEIAQFLKENDFLSSSLIKSSEQKKQAKEIADFLKNKKQPVDGLDVALFGRMVAQAASMNVEAASSFSHAISTHKVANEIDFFTALDDASTEQGSAHMGSIEFNSATYYRYVSLDLGQLCQSIGKEHLAEAVEKFTQALYLSVPGARQSTQSAASRWDFAKIFVRKGQRLQVPFETAIKSENGGFLNPSIVYLKKCLSEREKIDGKLFGKISDYTIGIDECGNAFPLSFDELSNALKSHV